MGLIPLTPEPVQPTPEQQLRLEWAASLRDELDSKGFTPKAFHAALLEAGASVSLTAVYAWLAGTSAPSPLNQAYAAGVLRAPAHRLFPLPKVA